MEVGEEKVRTGKPYEGLTGKEKALVVDFAEEEHVGMRLKYGKRLKYVTVQVDEDERYDYLIVHPSKNTLLVMAEEEDDLEETSDILTRDCIAADNMKALKDSAVYASVLAATGQLIAG